MMFPPGITVAAKDGGGSTGLAKQTSESVFQRLLGNPPDSWVRGNRLKTELRRKHVTLAREPKRRGAQAIALTGEDGLREWKREKGECSVPR